MIARIIFGFILGFAAFAIVVPFCLPLNSWSIQFPAMAGWAVFGFSVLDPKKLA